MKGKTGPAIVLISVIAGAIGFFGVLQHLQATEKGRVEAGALVAIAVAVKEIPARTELKEELVSYREMPSRYVTQEYVTEKQLGGFLGSRILRTVKAGQPILAAYFAPDLTRSSLEEELPVGQRAVTIKVNEYGGLAGFLRPGHYVDVMATYDIQPPVQKTGMQNSRLEWAADKRRFVTFTLLQNKRVLAIDFYSGAREGVDHIQIEPGMRYGSVTLLVSSEEAEMLAFGQAVAAFHLALRNRTDAQNREIDPFGTNELLKRFKNGLQPFLPLNAPETMKR